MMVQNEGLSNLVGCTWFHHERQPPCNTRRREWERVKSPSHDEGAYSPRCGAYCCKAGRREAKRVSVRFPPRRRVSPPRRTTSCKARMLR
jgi:hypothetical protein